MQQSKTYAFSKWQAWPLRARHVFEWWPIRFKRLAQHFWCFCWRLDWFLELPFYVLDVLLVPEILESIQDLIFWRQRPLLQREYEILKAVFGDSLPYPRIRIDENAYLGPKTHRLFYVQCCSIKSWGGIPDRILVHEAVHIWQFCKVGSVYIPRALKAQVSEMGYNYGGLAGVVKAWKAEMRLLDFNYEQQADIIADYWYMNYSQLARESIQRVPADQTPYLYFALQLKE